MKFKISVANSSSPSHKPCDNAPAVIYADFVITFANFSFLTLADIVATLFPTISYLLIFSIGDLS